MKWYIFRPFVSTTVKFFPSTFSKLMGSKCEYLMIFYKKSPIDYQNIGKTKGFIVVETNGQNVPFHVAHLKISNCF